MRRISEYVEVQRFAAGELDSHGNESESWGSPESVGIYAFDPGGSSEPVTDGHDRSVTEPTLYMPASVVLGPRDRVTARGVLHEVEGETGRWVHPRRARAVGNVAQLKVVSG